MFRLNKHLPHINFLLCYILLELYKFLFDIILSYFRTNCESKVVTSKIFLFIRTQNWCFTKKPSKLCFPTLITYLSRIHKQGIQFSNCEFHSHKHKVAFSYQRQFPENWQEYIITHCFICAGVHKVFYQWEPTYCEGEVFFPRLMRLISFFLFIYSNPFIRWLRKCVFMDVKEHSVGPTRALYAA